MYYLKWKFLQIARVLAKADTLVIIMSALAKSRDSKGNWSVLEQM